METKLCIGFISRSASTMKIFIKFYQYKLVSAKIITNADPYSEPWWASEMESFVKIVNGFRLFTTFVSSMLDVSQGSEYFSGMSLLTNIFLELSKISQSYYHSISPHLSTGGEGGNFQYWKWGIRKKMNVWGFKEFLAQMFAWGLTMFLVKKRLCKIKYGYERSVSNVDLGSLPGSTH